MFQRSWIPGNKEYPLEAGKKDEPGKCWDRLPGEVFPSAVPLEDAACVIP